MLLGLRRVVSDSCGYDFIQDMVSNIYIIKNNDCLYSHYLSFTIEL